MDQKNDKKAGAPIPTLKDSLRPQLKIKGLQSGQSLIERLKQFKKKDLAFILAGLGVLFMAPLAEHFLMSPSDDSGSIKEGWGFKPGAGGLGQGGSPFESGLGGLAPGGAAGAGSDVITPLNVRDPSALVMGPGASQQPPAVASTPAPAASAPPPSSGSSDWKDALSQSAATAGKAAAAKASLPVPKVPLSNGGLRGLGVASGGGGGTFNVGAVPGAQFGKGGGGDSTGLARRTGDFKGAATRGSGSSNAGGFEQLKKQAGAQGSDISRAGSAISNLEQAAGRNMGSGTNGDGGAGAGGSSGADKASSASQDKGSKQIGESLEFLRLKQEQEKAIELKWEMIKKRAMFPLELQQEVMKTLIMGPVKAVSEVPGKMFGAIGAPAAGADKYVCTAPTNYEVARSAVAAACENEGGQPKNAPCCLPGTGCAQIHSGNQVYSGCSIKVGDAAASAAGNARGGVNNLDGTGNSTSTSTTSTTPVNPTFAAGLESACANILPKWNPASSQRISGGGLAEADYPKMMTRAKKLAEALQILGIGSAASCRPTEKPTPDRLNVSDEKPVKTRLTDVSAGLTANLGHMNTAATLFNNDVIRAFNSRARAKVMNDLPTAFEGMSATQVKQHLTAVTGAATAPSQAIQTVFTQLARVVPAAEQATDPTQFIKDDARVPLGDLNRATDLATQDLQRAETLATPAGGTDPIPVLEGAKARFTAANGTEAATETQQLIDAFRNAGQEINTAIADLRPRQVYLKRVIEDLGTPNGVLYQQIKLARTYKEWLTADRPAAANPRTDELRTTVKQFDANTKALLQHQGAELPDCAGAATPKCQGETAQAHPKEDAWGQAATKYGDQQDAAGSRPKLNYDLVDRGLVGHAVKLQEVLSDQKVPAHVRSAAPGASGPMTERATVTPIGDRLEEVQ